MRDVQPALPTELPAPGRHRPRRAARRLRLARHQRLHERPRRLLSSVAARRARWSPSSSSWPPGSSPPRSCGRAARGRCVHAQDVAPLLSGPAVRGRPRRRRHDAAENVLAFHYTFRDLTPHHGRATAVTLLGFLGCSAASARCSVCASCLPTRRDIDRPLVVGATLFGVGWGLVGLCGEARSRAWPAAARRSSCSLWRCSPGCSSTTCSWSGNRHENRDLLRSSHLHPDPRRLRSRHAATPW